MPKNAKGEYEAPEVRPPGPTVVRQAEVVVQPKEVPVVSAEHTTKLAQTLVELNSQMSATQQNARLIADPLIREYLEKKDRGEKVRLVSGNDPVSTIQRIAEPVEIDPKDLETMSNAELIQHLEKRNAARIESEVTKRTAELEKRWGETVNPQLEALAAAERSRVKSAVSTEWDALVKSHSDANEMKKAMAEINARVEGVTLEELYFLAKKRAGVPLVSQRELETEKPNQSPGERTARRSVTTARPNSRQSFDALVRSSLDQSLGQ